MRRRKGMALIVVLGVLTLVAAAIGLMTVSASRSVRGTAVAEAEAQLDQVILAAVSAIPAALAEAPPAGADLTLALPERLEDYAVQIRIERRDADVAEVRIAASAPLAHREVAVSFARSGAQWTAAGCRQLQ